MQGGTDRRLGERFCEKGQPFAGGSERFSGYTLDFVSLGIASVIELMRWAAPKASETSWIEILVRRS